MGTKPDPKSPAYKSTLAKFCRTLPGTTEDIKWEDHLVFSVGRKMYASMNEADAHQISFKCGEEDNLSLTQIDGVVPTPYAARFGWVSITRKGLLPAKELNALLAKSHGLVLGCLPRRVQLQITERSSPVKRAKPAAGRTRSRASKA